jgi:hypothetical protein
MHNKLTYLGYKQSWLSKLYFPHISFALFCNIGLTELKDMMTYLMKLNAKLLSG